MATLGRREKSPDYKDYVNFLDAYKNGKNENQNSKITCESYSNFLENSKNKKFAPVKPTLKKTNSLKRVYEKPNITQNVRQNGKPKTVKTEIFLTVNGDEDSPSQTRVEDVIKNFEKTSLDLPQKQSVQKSNSVGATKKLFESQNHSHSSNPKFKIPKHKSSKITSPNSKNGEIARPVLPKKYVIDQTDSMNSEIKIGSSGIILQSPRVDKHVLEIHLATNPISKDDRKSEEILEITHTIEKTVETTHIQAKKSVNNVQEIGTDGGMPPPPPPPLPVNYKTHISPKSKQISKNVSLNNTTNTNGNIKNTTAKLSNKSNGEAGTLDRNDPLVKKLVYGAMLNMYGSYHNKANDYVATLPRDMVKQNGLQSIIDSIAAQGGLDKLSGRAAVEND